MRVKRWDIFLIFCLFWACGTSLAQAQVYFSPREILAKDRPESWVMKLIGSELQMTAMGIAGGAEPWKIEFGAELGWIPSLDDNQRLIGFDGLKRENVNRTSIFARPRVEIAFPAKFSLGVGYIPPIRIGGIRPNVLAMSLGRPIVLRPRWRLAGRIHGQAGTLSGDITCDQDTVNAGNDPVQNPFNCAAPSDDQMRVHEIGAELAAAFKVTHRLEPYVAPGWNYFANRFQINALYSGVSDHSLLIASGPTFSLTAGAAYRLSEKLRAAVETFYVPLSVKRGGVETTDSLFNVRGSVFYSIR